MKIRLIISDHSWEYRLHAAEQMPGRYYVTLRSLNGAKLMHAPVVGPFESLDAIRHQGEALYLKLVAKFQEPFFTPQPAPAAVPVHALTGDPAVDRHLE
jgi:hypothetical protein